jgi:hypothetical protein
MHFEVPKSKSLKEFGGEYLNVWLLSRSAAACSSSTERGFATS